MLFPKPVGNTAIESLKNYLLYKSSVYWCISLCSLLNGKGLYTTSIKKKIVLKSSSWKLV